MNKNLTKIRALAISKMNEHMSELVNHQGWTFRFNHSKKSAGCCDRGASVPDHEVLDTILHEIAHALTPGHHHDQVWKRVARSIGANGERCYSDSSHTYARMISLATWVGTCPAGHGHHKFRAPNLRSACAICSPVYNVKNIITWRRRK
jgi:hypothetical protein